MTTITLARGDFGPLLTFSDTLTSIVAGVETAVDLTAATSVLFLLKHAGGTPISKTATFVDRPAGKVAYVPQSTDLAVSGSYSMEWEVTFPDGKVTFPSASTNRLYIREDLNPPA